MRGSLLIVMGALVPVFACGGHDFEPPDPEARVISAEARLTPLLFDSLSWADDSVRLFEGNETYATKCRRCHGTFGVGGTEYAAKRGLEVPSLVDPDWIWADSLGPVRRRIFIGHSTGMPTWGVAGITPRQIDASAYYLLFGLRPDALAMKLGEPNAGQF